MIGYSCRHYGCPNLSSKKGGYCEQHKGEGGQAAIQARQGRRLKVYGSRRWREASLAFRAQHPICQICNSAPSEVVHHVTPAREDEARFWDPDNWQAVCNDCHNRERAREGKEARCGRG